MSKLQEGPLKILITSMISIGHLNACLGIGLLLKKRGHDVYLAHYLIHRSTIEKCGLKFIGLSDYQHKDYEIEETSPVNQKIFKAKIDTAMRMSPLQILKDEIESANLYNGWIRLVESSKAVNYAMLNILNHLKPDLCLADYLFTMPWMVKTDIPVVPVMSTAPCDLYDGPPMMSGYSVNSPVELWREFRVLKEKSKSKFVEKAKESFQMFGVDFVDHTHAAYLGIYVYPGPLDYKELGQPKRNWVRLDSAIRLTEVTKFKIPDKIVGKPGKLIYLSMGTLASRVPEMMNMVLEPLANVPHRFIVSTGPNGDEVKLYDNMWGDKFVDQVTLLPHIDLFITHGGSNSLIEGLVAGKPLIVIPQFGDQLDNGQRVVDLKLGAKINLWEFSGDQLIEAIENVLNNDEILKNVLRTSEELKKSDSSDKVCSLIEKLARTKKSPF